MKQFALLFYIDITSTDKQPDEATMQAYMHDWNAWTDGLANSGKLIGGNHFGPQAATITSDAGTVHKPVLNGSLSVAGYLVISASDLNDALESAKKCPILNGEGNKVEVREIA